MTTGQRIGELAKKRKINLHQLAKLAGVSYNTLYSIVRRKSDKVDHDTVCRIAAALGVSQVELTTGKDEQAWRDLLELEMRQLEAENLEKFLAVFAMRNPLFFEALNNVGVSIRIEDKKVYADRIEEKKLYADWEDISVQLTMADIEELCEEMQENFLESIQRRWSIPIADEYMTEKPQDWFEKEDDNTDQS